MDYLSRPKNPCRQDCPYRDAFCRIDCEDYKEYEEKYKQYYEAKRKSQKAKNEIVSYSKELDMKFKKAKNRRKR